MHPAPLSYAPIAICGKMPDLIFERLSCTA